MPTRLANERLLRTDRRLLWCVAACALLLIAGIALTIPPGRDSARIPSIYSSGSGGARAAYLLLRDLHVDVRTWEEPPASLADVANNATVILAEPSEAPSAADIASLREFVNGGGRVLFCGAAIAAFFPEARVSAPVESIEWKEFDANLPSAISRDANPVIMRPKAYWRTPDHSQISLYGSEDSAAVVSWSIGEGEVVWWAGATPLTNAGISKSGNLNLFLNSVSGSSSGGPAPVYWDEYFHGERASLMSYVVKTPAVWAGAQIVLVALAVLFTFSRRSGPIVMARGVSRLSPLEFVDTMGALYRHAGASSIPVEVSYRHLRVELARRLGLPSATRDDELARVAAERLGFDGAALAHTLRESAQSAIDGKLRDRHALALVQDIERFVAQLNRGKD